MRIKINENSLNLEELNQNLTNHFSGKYEVNTRTKDILDVAETKNIGASVILTKKYLNINGGFPSATRSMVFTILTVALGIIPPLIIYFIFFHKKMKAVEKDVGEFVTENYQSSILA